MFEKLADYLLHSSTGPQDEIMDRVIVHSDGTLEIDCYFMGEEFDVDAWEDHKVYVKPERLSRRAFRAAYRIARVIRKALEQPAANIVLPKVPAGVKINIDIMPLAPFQTV
jgi:hypothetical protein